MPKTVLAVDDSKTMRDMVSFTLKEAGYNALVAEDGNAALGVLQANSVDAIITDLNMPGMNGFELIRNLRANAKYKFTPILMLTTEGDDSKKQEGKAAGATGWIVKPFNPQKLIEVVKKVCP
jgi:two-component system, chemotaxis family, chemotaxis protein CheY